MFSLSVASSLVQAADESVLLAAQNMLNEGQTLQALELLNPHEEDYAGDKQFDYLYGLALLDTGEPASAVFAFQRALAVDPNFAGARLELARSYFDMGQVDRAQREFNLLQSQSPPDSVNKVIENYLAAIESRNIRSRRGWRGFLQFGFGDDSNANNATSANSFLGYTLTDESREAQSSVISALGGARYDLPLGISSKFFFDGSVNQRSNNDASYTSTVNLDLTVGYSKRFKSQNDLSTAVQFYTADVDGEANNKGLNFTGQYNHGLSQSDQVGVFLRLGKVDYVDEFDEKDIDQTIFGLNWAHVFGGESRISLVASTIAGQDETVESDSPYSRDFSGVRLSLAYPFTHRFNLFSSIGQTTSEYDGTFFDESEAREDTLSDFSLGVAWRVNKTWVLRAIAGQNENTSNIDLFDYDKTVVMFIARSEFLP